MSVMKTFRCSSPSESSKKARRSGYDKSSIISDTESVKQSKNEDNQNKDVMTQIVGEFGKWQLHISILMSLLKLCNAWYQLNIIFMAPIQPFYCKKPPSFSHYSVEEWRKISQPVLEEEACLIYDPDLLLVNKQRIKTKVPLVYCKHFEFDTSTFKRTILSDWDLVCDRRWMMHACQVIAMFGFLIGGLIYGVRGDTYGRRSTLLWCITGQTVASLFLCATPGYWLFVAVRFVQALFGGGIAVVSFVLCLEVVDGKWRTIIPIIYQIPFGLGITIMALLASLFRDWRKTELGLAIMSSFYLLYWLWIPESPRWLLANGKLDEAVDVLYVAALKNGKQDMTKSKIRKLITPKSNDHSRKAPTFSAFLKYKSMRLKTIMLSLSWLLTGIAFFTFSQYLGYLFDNIFSSVAVAGLIAMPGPLVCAIFVLKYQRKRIIWVLQFIMGLSFIVIMLIPREYEWTRVNIAGFGYSAMSAYVPTLYLYSGELYPTLGRNRGVALVTMFARFGSMLGTFFANLDYLMPDLTLIVIAIMSFAQIALLIPLPETKGKPLLDTIEECELFTNENENKFVPYKLVEADSDNQ